MALVYKQRTVTNSARQSDNSVTHITPWNLSQHPFEIDPKIPYFTDSRIKGEDESLACGHTSEAVFKGTLQ